MVHARGQPHLHRIDSDGRHAAWTAMRAGDDGGWASALRARKIMSDGIQNVLVIGATGGSGRAAVEALLAGGHRVTAFSRSASKLAGLSPRLRTIDGDAMDAAQVERAIAGHDAVVVTLGITESPVRVRVFGPRATPLDVRSAGTRNVIEGMKRHRVRNLVVQSSYGVGDSRDKLGFGDRLIFALLLAPQIADTEVQEQLVRESGLDWVLVQPVHLTDGAGDDVAFASADAETRQMRISRRTVGRFLARAVAERGWVGRTVALSAEPTTPATAGPATLAAL